MPSKNKGKALMPPSEPTERSPLLGTSSSNTEALAPPRLIRSSSTSASEIIVGDLISPEATTHSRRRTRRLTILVSVFSLFFGIIVVLIILTYSFVPTETEQQSLHEAFVYADPKVDILNVSDDGVHINLTLRGGVDVERALAVDGRRGSGWWESLRRITAHRLLTSLPTQAVYLTVPQVLVASQMGGPLLSVDIPNSIVVPLTRKSELVNIAIEAVGNPVAPVGQLWTWGQETWANGTIDVVVRVAQAQATIPGAWWSRWAVVDQKNVVVPLAVPVPNIPNLPPPGKPLDLAALVTLNEYTFTNDPDLKITALASLPNPALKEVPFALPFNIQLGPDHDTIAQVVARPAKVTTNTIGLVIEGDIISLDSGDALSTFLQNYIHGKGNPITVRGRDSMPRDYSHPDAPPPFILRSLPSLQLDLVFPAPPDQPDIIRSVTIEKMKFGQADGRMMASGTVVANIQLPPGMETVALNVSAIRPDVMVHDGLADKNVEYDPENPPPKAFGRIAPDYYLNSTTSPSEDPSSPHALVVRAPFENLILDVLPGRDGVLSDFVTKVVFKGGATAGVAGIVDVQADLGMGSMLALDGLPVNGEFWVGRNIAAFEAYLKGVRG